jgi:hypothetical protein
MQDNEFRQVLSHTSGRFRLGTAVHQPSFICNCYPLAVREPKWTVANPVLSEM